MIFSKCNNSSIELMNKIDTQRGKLIDKLDKEDPIVMNNIDASMKYLEDSYELLQLLSDGAINVDNGEDMYHKINSDFMSVVI